MKAIKSAKSTASDLDFYPHEHINEHMRFCALMQSPYFTGFSGVFAGGE